MNIRNPNFDLKTYINDLVGQSIGKQYAHCSSMKAIRIAELANEKKLNEAITRLKEVRK